MRIHVRLALQHLREANSHISGVLSSEQLGKVADKHSRCRRSLDQRTGKIDRYMYT